MREYRVFLVDDEIKIREGFKKLFNWKEHGCEIIGEAGDGIHAVNAISELKPDIVIMDINIPILSGLDVIRRVKKISPHTAFIIVSGYDDFSYCREALHLKVEEYILKPVNFREFGEVLDNLKITIFQNSMNRKMEETEKGGNARKQDPEKTDENKEEARRQIYLITKYIQEHLKEEISLKIIAGEFYLSNNYVSHLFRNEIGVNYLTYLTHLRIEKAKSLLVGTGKSISEIAEEVGFNDYRAFNKAFKKVEKVTPSQYRKEF